MRAGRQLVVVSVRIDRPEASKKRGNGELDGHRRIADIWLFRFFRHLNLSRGCAGGSFLINQERVRMVGGLAWCVVSSFVAIVVHIQ